jgi:hypothetical protein
MYATNTANKTGIETNFTPPTGSVILKLDMQGL